MEFSDMYALLREVTENFTKQEYELPVESLKDKEMAKTILRDHYDTVSVHLDMLNEGSDGVDYLVESEDPDTDLHFAPAFGGGPVMEEVEKHDELNQDIWDGDELKPEVKDKLLEIADIFIDKLKKNNINIDVEDIVIVGSSASYNYNKTSDIDCHLVADCSQYGDYEELAYKLYDAYKSAFNDKYTPTIYGWEVEIYVESKDNPPTSNGRYSLNTGWIKRPTKETIPDIDQTEIDGRVETFIDRFNDLDSLEDAKALLNDIYVERHKGILTGGEYSPENLTFKEFRSQGYLQDLKDKIVEFENDEMSLESLKDNIKTEAIHPDLKGIRPYKSGKWDVSLPAGAVTKVNNIIDEMAEEDYDTLSEFAYDAYIDKDKDALAIVKPILRKYGLPMWALQVYVEGWED